MNEMLNQIVIFTVIGLIVWGLSWVFRCKEVDTGISNPKKSSKNSFIAIAISMVIMTLTMFLHLKIYGIPLGDDKSYEDIGILTVPVVFIFIFLGPAVFFMIKEGEPLKSIGISKKNLWQTIVIGSALSIISIMPYDLSPLWNLEKHIIISFVYFAIIGFQEEILFRGYFQIRLVAWLGKWQGVILASVIMALFHFPQRIFLQELDLLPTFIETCKLIPISLLMGFIMYRTKNVIGLGIFHTFANWVGMFH